MRSLFWILFALLASLTLSAQEVVLPAKPDRLILDETRFFSPEEIQTLETKLHKFREETGLELYIYAVSYSPLNDIQNLSRVVVGAWEKEYPAMIVGYSRGEDRPYVHPGTKFMDKFALDFVFNFCRSLNEDERALNGRPQDRIEHIVDRIISEFTRRHQEMAALQARESRMLQRFMYAGLGGLFLLSAFVYLLSKKLTPVLLEKIQRTELPKVHMPIRLQAPFGGGKLACTESLKPKSTEE